MRVSACVAPSNSPCSLFYANVVPLAQQVLEPISGGGQISTGQAFQPVIVRVTDSSSPPDSIMAAPVKFFMTVLRNGKGSVGNDGNPVQPVILAVSQTSASTDMNGLANIVPSASGFGAPVDVDVSVTAGNSALDYPLQVLQPPVEPEHCFRKPNPTGERAPHARRRCLGFAVSSSEGGKIEPRFAGSNACVHCCGSGLKARADMKVLHGSRGCRLPAQEPELRSVDSRGRLSHMSLD